MIRLWSRAQSFISRMQMSRLQHGHIPVPVRMDVRAIFIEFRGCVEKTHQHGITGGRGVFGIRIEVSENPGSLYHGLRADENDFGFCAFVRSLGSIARRIRARQSSRAAISLFAARGSQSPSSFAKVKARPRSARNGCARHFPIGLRLRVAIFEWSVQHADDLLPHVPLSNFSTCHCVHNVVLDFGLWTLDFLGEMNFSRRTRRHESHVGLKYFSFAPLAFFARNS